AASLPQPGLFAPQPAPRSCFYCEPGVHTTTLTATAGNCQDALNKIASQGRIYANTDCLNRDLDGICTFAVLNQTCTLLSPGTWQEQGTAEWTCALNIC